MTRETGLTGQTDLGHPPERVPELLRRAGVVEQAPHPRVWRAVSATLPVVSRADQRPGDQRPGDQRPGDQRPGDRRPRDRGRPAAGALPLLAAAAAGALVTWLGVGLADREAPEEVVASGTLAPLGAEAPSGTARVLDVDGEQVLQVELTQVPDAGDGYLEVWLLRPDVSGMVTLGVLDGAEAQFTLPADLDLSDFPVVDISRERLDGDPAHGGDSLVRGDLG